MLSRRVITLVITAAVTSAAVFGAEASVGTPLEYAV